MDTYEVTKQDYSNTSTTNSNYQSTNVATETINLENNTGKLDKNDIDFTKISTSIGNVLNGKTVSVNEKYWGDTGELTYEIRKGDVVAIMENGQILGFTTLDGINKKPAAENVTVTTPEVGQKPVATPTNSEPTPSTDTEMATQYTQTQQEVKPEPVVTATEESTTVEEPTNQTSIPSPTAEDVYTQTQIEQPPETPVETPQFQYKSSGNTIKVGDYNNPYDNLVVSSTSGATQTYINGQVAERRKVNYTDDDLYYMAQLVENEASSSGVTGQVAVAEEIRNRVLSSDPYYKDTVTGVLDQGYTPWASKDPRKITPKQETLDLCKGVLDGNIWVFGRDDVLSHASHSGKGIPGSQPGVNGSSSYAAFYYDGIDRTQTFYTSGNLTEETRLV